jgi:exodeoxyribonuclease VII small subunit
MAAKPAPDRQADTSFETAMARLEEIVDAMESNKMPLEELIVRYEEGVKLVRVCQEKLEAAEKRIELITKNAAGKPQLMEFEPSATVPVSPAIAKAEAQDVSLF